MNIETLCQAGWAWHHKKAGEDFNTGGSPMAEQAEALETLPYRCISLCLEALDEPVFVLRARDILAPRVVTRWAHLAEGAGSPWEKVHGALVIAKQMADWQAKNPDRVKVPD